MILYVHLTHPRPGDGLTILKSHLDSRISLTVGDDVPKETQILIAGRPSRLQLTTPNLQTLVIPWSGLPLETADLLANFPHISVHNLHHGAVVVAETAVMLLLTAAKNTIAYDQTLRQHDWRMRYEPSRPPYLLQGKTAVILGYGAIGQEIGRLCLAFGMKVLATRRSLKTAVVSDGVHLHPTHKWHKLLPQADALIIAVPHTSETDGLIGEREFNLMPETAVLVNISRGPVVDEAALFQALQEKKIAAAGIDVWYNYPPDKEARAHTPPANFPFHELDNVVMSPHRAGHSDETERLRMEDLAKLLNTAVSGKIMPNKIDLSLGY